MTSTDIPEYIIRDCVSIEDYAACLEMQRSVWGFEPLDITPLRSFVITRRGGGFTLGAFDKSERLLGFAHALPAFDEKLRPYYYSQMLAVDPALQNSGIGVRLKLAQREHALKAGIELMTWTFDPLQSRNAYFNLVKLGGVIRNYMVNYYGNQSTSVLHRGLDTDRVLIQWWMRSRRVIDAIEGQHCREKVGAIIEVPREIEAIKRRDLEEARNWQLRVRTEFQNRLGEGLYCVGFETGLVGGNSRYLFINETNEIDL
ncbi:MAG: GNAT family N-acetyltransferase [Acidobacteria bacterium]|nr:GNAT family N-acetyltransferase [Acidobacteriota bacterium]